MGRFSTIALFCGVSVSAAFVQADEAARSRAILQWGHQGPITHAAWTPDSRFIVTGSNDRRLILWDREGRVVDQGVLPRPDVFVGEVWKITVDADGKGAVAVSPVENTDTDSGISWHWRFGHDLAEPPQPAPSPPLFVENDKPVSPDGRWALAEGAAHVMVVQPNGGGRKVALVGQEGFSDAALSVLAYDREPKTASAAELAEIHAAEDREMNGLQDSGSASAEARWRPSPDGRRLAWFQNEAGPDPDNDGGVTINRYVRVIDLENGQFFRTPPLETWTDGATVSWIDAGRFVVASGDTAERPLVVSTSSADPMRRGPPLCFAVPLGGAGDLVGAGTANCRRPDCFPADANVASGPSASEKARCAEDLTAGPAQGLWIEAANGVRRQLDTGTFQPAERGRVTGPDPRYAEAVANGRLDTFEDVWTRRFLRVAASPDGSRVAATWREGSKNAKAETIVWDARTGARLTRIADEGDLTFVGRHLAIFGNGARLYDTDTGGRLGSMAKVVDELGNESAVQAIAGNRFAVREKSGAIGVFDARSGARVGRPVASHAGLDWNAAEIAWGVMPNAPLVWTSPEKRRWTVSREDTGATLFTLYILGDDRFFVVDPDGRYDSNLPADSRAVRWQVTDDPLKSLAAQTFMRTFYTPGLMRILLDRAKGGNPNQGLAPIPDLARLDRVLPSAKVTGLRVDAAKKMAAIDVEAAEGVDPSAANGETRSGLHDLRLFRDGRLVARYPEPATETAAPSAEERLKSWREETAIPEGIGRSVFRHTFSVALPKDAPGRPVVFTAYAFNKDRVKGETSTPVRFTPPPAAKGRQRRAYVIAVGVDEAAEPAWTLHFAAADARAIAAGLATIPGHRVTALALTSTAAARQATSANIHDVLRVLATGDLDAKTRLTGVGIAAEGLAQVTPDDLVILTFSGHGWADRNGAFYLVPGGGRRAPGGAEPDPASLISAGDLTEWLRGVDAGETAIVIDACQSAASVDAGNFKPGPLGDPGLGQLAFDKGIRILAAAQANEEAQEDPKFGQGLLTYALVEDGLKARRLAELRLDQWLVEGAARLPTLRPPPAPFRHRVLASPDDDYGAPAQEPALFDFTGKRSDVVLRPATAATP